MQLELLDGDSQEILGLLSCAPELPAPVPKQTKETVPSRLGHAANTIKKASQVSVVTLAAMQMQNMEAELQSL